MTWTSLVFLVLTLFVLAGCTPPGPVPQAPNPRGEMMAPPPRPRVTSLGVSVQSRPIQLNVFGDAPRPVLVLGGIHGSEPTSVYVAAQLADYLRAHPQLWTGPTGRSVAVIPVANPDGYARLSRTNANGVDINRNFPAKNFRVRAAPHPLYNSGPEPLSEPESRAIKQAIDTLRPRLIISIHSIEKGKFCNNYDGPAEPIARIMAQHNGYPVTGTMGYPTPGSLGSYAGIDQQIPIITLELPREQSGEQAWQQNRDALLAALRATPPASPAGAAETVDRQ
jgi:predicted deacylase